MANIYQLSTEVQDLYNKLLDSVDEETGEIDSEVLGYLDTKKEEFEQKALNVATFIRSIDRKIDEIKAETERLTAIKKRLETHKESFKNMLADSCLRVGLVRADGLHANISFRKSEKVIIDNEEEIPDDFQKIKIEKIVDKTKIKDAIKKGATVAGAHVETFQNIQIK